MLIETFDPAADQQRLRACYEIVEACGRHDDPDLPGWSFGAFSAGWAHGWGTPHQAWLARGDAGEPVGCYLLLLPDKANLTTGSCLLFMAPGSRRSGHGRRLLAHCAEQARLAGRTRLRAEVTEDGPGASFAVSVGASIGISEVIRVLAIDEGLSARLAILRARAEEAAGGYSLVSWQGPTPEELIYQTAAIEVAMQDAPRDPGVEPDTWDADRIRKTEQQAVAFGRRTYSVAARHDDSHALVALTQIGADPGVPGWGFQAITAVLAGHRGHRLGLLLKVANLELVLSQEPGLHSIVTGNAGPNQHMIAINELLGFRVRSVRRSCELDLTGPASWPDNPVARVGHETDNPTTASKHPSGAATA